MDKQRYDSVAVIGGGQWGTALALAAARSCPKVVLYSERPEYLTQVNDARTTPFFADVALPESLRVTSYLQELHQVELVLIAVAAQKVRAVATKISAISGQWPPFLICSKGIEIGTGLLPSQVISEVMPEARLAVLSGPNFASEVAANQLTASIIATPHKVMGHKIINTLQDKNFLLCYSDDLLGTQVLGASKNVYAIAAGIAAGLELGKNARAALIAAAVTEMSELCVVLGGKVATMLGAAGIGDLYLSASNQTSRNMDFGYQIGRGQPVAEVLARNMLHEGYMTTKALYELASKLELDMPVLRAVYGVLYEGLALEETVEQLTVRG